MCTCLRVAWGELGEWVGGLCWRMVPSHVCSCVDFLTPGLVADGTVSEGSNSAGTGSVGHMGTGADLHEHANSHV